MIKIRKIFDLLQGHINCPLTLPSKYKEGSVNLFQEIHLRGVLLQRHREMCRNILEFLVALVHTET